MSPNTVATKKLCGPEGEFTADGVTLGFVAIFDTSEVSSWYSTKFATSISRMLGVAWPRDAEMRGFLGYAQALSGRTDEAARLAASAEYPNEQALIFAGLRDGDRAIEAIGRMAMVGPQRVGMYLNYPEFAFLTRDPRVTALRKTVGLPLN